MKSKIKNSPSKPVGGIRNLNPGASDIKTSLNPSENDLQEIEGEADEDSDDVAFDFLEDD